MISIISGWYILLQYILAYLRYLEIICEIWSDWSISIWSSLYVQLINILTKIGKQTAVYNVWAYRGIQSNRVVNHIYILTWILNIVAVANKLIDFYILLIWSVSESNILTHIFHILWIFDILTYTCIWLWIITIEIDKLTHAGYLWASIKHLFNWAVCISWNINITNILIQTCLRWRVWKTLVVSGVLQNVNVVHIHDLQRVIRWTLTLTSEYLRYVCYVN